MLISGFDLNDILVGTLIRLRKETAEYRMRYDIFDDIAFQAVVILCVKQTFKKGKASRAASQSGFIHGPLFLPYPDGIGGAPSGFVI